MKKLNNVLKGQKLVSVKNTAYSCILEVENTTDNTRKEYEIFMHSKDDNKDLLFYKILYRTPKQPNGIIDDAGVTIIGMPAEKILCYYTIRLKFVNGEELEFYWDTKDTLVRDKSNHKKFKVSIKQI